MGLTVRTNETKELGESVCLVELESKQRTIGNSSRQQAKKKQQKLQIRTVYKANKTEARKNSRNIKM